MSSSQIINILQRSIELIERYTQCILTGSEDNHGTFDLKELEVLVLNFSNAIAMTQAKEKFFNKFKDTVESSLEELNDKIIIDKYSKEVNALSKIAQKPDDRYKKFLKLIKEKQSNNNDEIITESETMNFIDPILKLPIVEPVKNKRCGHIYEKSTIIQLINTNSKTKCPIAGCTIDYVKKSDLISDNMLKIMVSNNQKISDNV